MRRLCELVQSLLRLHASCNGTHSMSDFYHNPGVSRRGLPIIAQSIRGFICDWDFDGEQGGQFGDHFTWRFTGVKLRGQITLMCLDVWRSG